MPDFFLSWLNFVYDFQVSEFSSPGVGDWTIYSSGALEFSLDLLFQAEALEIRQKRLH